MDFSKPYAATATKGYVSLYWKPPTSDGKYEIMVATECEAHGSEDVDGFREDILTGAIDLTAPEKFGPLIPIREDIILGEEMSVVFTEPIDCSEPFSFDVQLIIDGIDDPLNKDNNLQVICEGRKIGVKIDPTFIPDKIPSFLGQAFTLEIGKITNGKVTDVYDNEMKPAKIGFRRSFAQLDLYSAPASFRLLMENAPCDINASTKNLSDHILNEISSIGGLGDMGRISLNEVHCAGDNKVAAEVHVSTADKETGANRGLRAEQDHSIAIYSKIRHFAKQNMRKEGERSLSTEEGTGDPVRTFTVSKLRILPAESDLEKFKTSPKNVEEERKLKLFTEEGADGEVLSDSHYTSLELDIEGMRIDNQKAKEEEINELKEANQKAYESLNESLFRKLEKERKDDMKSAFFQSFLLMVLCVGFILAAFSHLMKHK